jgi:hypothetical protein
MLTYCYIYENKPGELPWPTAAAEAASATGWGMTKGKIGFRGVDAILIAAPRQRNNEDEKKAIKEGRN